MSRNPRSKPPEAKPFNIITTIKSSMDLQTYLEERPQLNLSLMLDAQNSTLIHFAVYHNDMPKLKLYLSHFDAFLRSSHGQAQFQITVQSQLKSWINKVNNEGNTAIHYAALSGNNEMIELLFRKGANIHFVNNNCENILFMCVQANKLKTLIWLINSEHRFRLEDVNILGENILHEAARCGFLHLTEYLLTVNINPLAQNTKGETALVLAVRSGAKQIVKKMLLKGIDRHIRNQEGQDAIAIAKSLEKEDLVKILNDQHSLQDSIKIACNRKITYQKEESSLAKPIFFVLLFNLLFLPIAYLAEIVPARTLTFIPFIALGIYYALTMILFFLLMIKHPKRERVDLTDLELPICPECSNSKPPLVFHCFICATCIYRYDHHCPWINNCVGTKNIGKFTAFLALTIIGCLYSIFGHVCLYFNILTNLVVLRDNPIPQIAIIQAVNIATTLLCGFFGFCIGMLFYEQLGNLCSNTTAYERSRKKQKKDRERERSGGQDSVETFNDLHKQSSLLSQINNDAEEEEQSCNCFGNCCRMLSQKAV